VVVPGAASRGQFDGRSRSSGLVVAATEAFVAAHFSAPPLSRLPAMPLLTLILRPPPMAV